MSDPQTNESPFQSPGGSVLDSAREVLGESNYSLALALQSAYRASTLQWGSLTIVFLLATLGREFIDPEIFASVIPGVMIAVIILAQLYSMGSTVRLTRALDWHWGHVVFQTILVGIPLYGTFVLAKLTSPVREALEAAGVPFNHTGIDWDTLAQITAENQEPRPVNPFSLPRMNQLYHLVFCDEPQLASIVLPSITELGWLEPQAQLSDAADLRAIMRKETTDCRVRLLAAAQLRSTKEDPGEELGLGIVFESKPENEHYVVAMYADGGMACLRGKSDVRLLSPGSEGLAGEVRELVTEVMEQRLLFAEAPDTDRKSPPPGEARITLLTTAGARVGQATWKAFHKLPITRPVADAAISLVDRLHGFEPAVKSQVETIESIPTDLQLIIRYQRTAIAAMVIYGLSLLILVRFSDVSALSPFGLGKTAIFIGATAYTGYAVFQLMKSLGRPGAGLTYGLLSIFPGVPLVTLGFAYFLASQYRKTMKNIGR